MRKKDKSKKVRELWSAGPAPDTPRAWTWAIPCALGLAVYIPSLFNGFIRDDRVQIANNPQVQSWGYLFRLLTTHLWSEAKIASDQVFFYRPLFSIWMLLVNTVGGLSPWAWHLSNILLHVAATYLVFVVCRRLLKSDIAASLAAVVFAVDPIHVDAVSWVSASNEILFVIFFLGSVLLLIPATTSGPLPRSRVLWSVILYGAALFTKETAVAILPILVGLGAFNPEDNKWHWNARTVLKISTGYLVATFFYFAVRFAVLGRVGVESGRNSWQQTIFSSPSVAIFYLNKLMFPIRLSGCYLTPLISAPTVGMWLTLMGILAGVVLFAWLALRYDWIIGLIAALIVLPILPVLAGVRIYPQGDITHDRYLYLPSVGLCVLIGLGVRKLWSASTLARAALITFSAGLVAMFSYLTVVQQKYYKDDFVYYQRALDLYPANGMVLGYLGNLNMDRGRSALAMEEFRRAHEVSPDNPTVTLFLAHGLFDEHKYAEVEALLSPLLQEPNLSPFRKATALLTLANVEIATGKLDYGEQLLQQVEAMYPNFPEDHWAHGVLLQKEGRVREARAEYLKEFEITGDPEARKDAYALGRLLATSSSGNAAADHPENLSPGPAHE
jgi:tetratricopeptide (TPR) repeat protein